MFKMLNRMAALLSGLVITLALGSVPTSAAAQTYTLSRTFTGAGGVTGSATLEFSNTTLTNYSFQNTNSLPAELVSATLTFNNLGAGPATTTYNRSQLRGLYYRTDSAGAIGDLNFWANANSDGYSLNGTGPFVTAVAKNAYSVSVTNAAGAPAPAPAAIPTMTEWAIILFGMVLAGGAALYLQRRRMLGA